MEPMLSPAAGGSRSTIVHDPFDAEAFEEVLPRAPGLRLLLAESGISQAQQLAFDLFCSFYKYFVKLLPVHAIAPDCRRRRDLLERALDLREHGKLRAYTRLRAAETALATEFVLDALLKDLAPAKKERPPDRQPGEQPTPADATPVSMPEVTTEKLRELLRGAREDMEGAAELIATWSAGPGQETRLPPDLKLRLMRDLVRNPRLRRISQLFGRYRRLGLQERERSAVRASEEVVDFLRGGDVARALAGELSNFAMSEREDLFYSKVVTHQLLIYELWRRQDQPRPVYLCRDNSGSMAGEKEVWAKAAALALAHMALANRRPVDVVLFGDAADPLRVVSMRSEDDGPTRLTKVVDVASFFLGGGTDFFKPLRHILDAVKACPTAGHDLLFVSDGLCPLPEAFVREFQEAKARHDLRVTAVVIGGDAYSLELISDSIHGIEEISQAGDALAASFAVSFLEGGPEVRSPMGRRPAPKGRSVPLLFDHFLPESEGR